MAITHVCRGVLLLAGLTGSLPQANFSLVATYPHRKDCFTEGLMLNGTGTEVLESCGLTGQSYIRRYHLVSGKTLGQVGLNSKYFGEGLTVLKDSLLVLTYQHHEMLEYDARSLELVRTHPFPYGEGWGLTTDGCDLLATTGTTFIFRLRRNSVGQFELVRKVQVTVDGTPLKMVNELEYVTPKLWVNEWITNNIWRVDPMTGKAELKLNIGGLHPWSGEATPNGIAYSNLLGSDKLLVTGKLWPEMFALRLRPSELCGGTAKNQQCPAAPESACYRRTAAASMEGAPGLQEPAKAASPPLAAATKLWNLLPAALPRLPGGFAFVSSGLALLLFASTLGAAIMLGCARRRHRGFSYRQAST
eukprot:TRINITY_DN108481_c0_g1_i1.p1 TRINITY_DN108481_c0_g1~~TRINITY_DN108481_c0_g1_i1.p1  ORF type:complete len:361 (+),score=43.86 TRINITY_DN108481_c0_g1_i1:20-1102(+)